jgi:hypothetical protein
MDTIVYYHGSLGVVDWEYWNSFPQTKGRFTRKQTVRSMLTYAHETLCSSVHLYIYAVAIPTADREKSLAYGLIKIRRPRRSPATSGDVGNNGSRRPAAGHIDVVRNPRQLLR